MTVSIAGILVLSFLISAALLPILIRLSHHNEWYDSPDERKVHDGNIPRIGGIGIFWGFFISFIIFTGHIYNANIPFKLLGFIICGVLIHGIGLLDDFKNLRARYKFIGQLITGIILIFFGFHFNSIYIPFVNYPISSPIIIGIISLFWIVGVSNAVNLIDGIDGLSSVVTIVAALSIAAKSYFLGNTSTVFICFALIGSVLGFFVYNKPKAKIFMGDSGSLLLGYILALLPMLENTGMNKSLIFEGSLLILIVPITDTLFAMTRRIYRGINIGTPDKEHIHHLLLDFGFSNWKILGILGRHGFVLGFVTLLPVFFQEKNYLISVIFYTVFTLNFFLMYLIHRKWRKEIRDR